MVGLDGGMEMLKNKLYFIIKYVNLFCMILQTTNILALLYSIILEYCVDGEILFWLQALSINYKRFIGMSSILTIIISVLVILMCLTQKRRKLIKYGCLTLILSIFVFGIYFRHICTL